MERNTGAFTVLLAMIEVGWGHKGPAMAIAEELVIQDPDCRTAVVDLAREAGANEFDRAFKAAWDYSLAYPLGARIAYSLVNLMDRNRDRIFRAANADFIRKSAEYLRAEHPDMVVATHPICLHAAAFAREHAGLDFLLAGYVVDPFDAYALWAEPRTDLMFVASREARDRIIEYGYPAERVRITGFPFRRGFGEGLRPREEIRREFGVGQTGNPVVLASSGARGIGRIYDIVETSIRTGVPADFIVACGSNEETRASVEARVAKHTSRGRAPGAYAVLGYATNMPELMTAADIVAGKAGASTAMESFALGRPCAFTDWACQNDRRIIDWALAQGVGWWTPSARRLGRLLRRLATDGSLDRTIETVRALGIRSGSAEVAGHLLALYRGTPRTQRPPDAIPPSP